MVPMNWKMRLPAHHFVLIMPVKPTGKKKKIGSLTGWEIDPNYHGEIGLAAIQWWLHLEPRGFSMVLVLPCSILKVQENYSNQKTEQLSIQTLQE